MPIEFDGQISCTTIVLRQHIKLPGRTDYSRHLLLQFAYMLLTFVAVILHGMSGWLRMEPYATISHDVPNTTPIVGLRLRTRDPTSRCLDIFPINHHKVNGAGDGT